MAVGSGMHGCGGQHMWEKGRARLWVPACMGERQGASVGASAHGRKAGHICGGQHMWEKGGVHLWGPARMGEGRDMSVGAGTHGTLLFSDSAIRFAVYACLGMSFKCKHFRPTSDPPWVVSLLLILSHGLSYDSHMFLLSFST